MATRMTKDDKNRIAHNLTKEEYTVDASGRALGRVASEAASALLGKKSVNFIKNKVLPITVMVVHAKKISIPEKRIAEKTYVRYTGYTGGLYTTTLAEMLAKKGLHEVIKKTVDGMLPRNKLRKERMKRLVITD